MSSSAGQKVTTDPESFNTKNENPGVVANDSLAGESIQDGGSFAANSDYRGPLDQPARSLTANTTDTSNATKLDSAVSAGVREEQDEWRENQQLNAAGTLGGKESGVGPTYNKTVSGATNQSGSGQGAQAPGYAAHPAPSMGDNFQPKGKNLTEGGFDSDGPNASFITDIGGKNDPGRAALNAMEASNVPSAGGAGPRETQVSGDGQYSALDETSA